MRRRRRGLSDAHPCSRNSQIEMKQSKIDPPPCGKGARSMASQSSWSVNENLVRKGSGDVPSPPHLLLAPQSALQPQHHHARGSKWFRKIQSAAKPRRRRRVLCNTQQLGWREPRGLEYWQPPHQTHHHRSLCKCEARIFNCQSTETEHPLEREPGLGTP